jgi:hypothetical protein
MNLIKIAAAILQLSAIVMYGFLFRKYWKRHKTHFSDWRGDFMKASAEDKDALGTLTANPISIAKWIANIGYEGWSASIDALVMLSHVTILLTINMLCTLFL